jgi:hypothetical protein
MTLTIKPKALEPKRTPMLIFSWFNDEKIILLIDNMSYKYILILNVINLFNHFNIYNLGILDSDQEDVGSFLVTHLQQSLSFSPRYPAVKSIKCPFEYRMALISLW